MNEDDEWTDGAARCFLSYHTKDSEHWSDLGPTWAERIEAWLAPDYPEGVEVFQYADSGKYSPGSWPDLLRSRIRTCDILIALVTDHYLDRNQKAIAIELAEIKGRQDYFVPILITQHRPGEVGWDPDPDLMWVFDQNACSIKNYRKFGSDGRTPKFPPHIGDAIKRALAQARRAARQPQSSSPQAQPAIVSALTDVYASVGRSAPVSLPASLAQLELGIRSQEQLWTAAEELAVLLDERASDEVIQAWATRFLV